MFRALTSAPLVRTSVFLAANVGSNLYYHTYSYNRCHHSTSVPQHTGFGKRFASTVSASTSDSSSSSKKPFIDASRLPSTIPGVTPEELAAKLQAQMEKAIAQEEADSGKRLAAEVQRMQLSLSPEAFETYLVELNQKLALEEKERAKFAAMTPTQQVLYAQRQRRFNRLKSSLNSVVLSIVFFGTIFCMFGLFWFFY